MEDDTELRLYLRAIIWHWKLILGFVVLGSAIGLAIAFLSPKVYQATALVSVGTPPYSLHLEGVNQSANLPPRSYPDLALSDDVIAAVFRQMQPKLPSQLNTTAALRRTMSAVPAADPTLLRLTAEGQNPPLEAEIANVWAKALVEQANLLFGPGTDQVVNYETQLTAAHKSLNQAEQSLAAFEAQNQVPLLQAQLTALQFSLSDFLIRRHRYDLLIQDADDLLARLSQLDNNTPASTTDVASLLFLTAQSSGSGFESTQQRSFPQSGTTQLGAQQVSPGLTPIQIQIQIGTTGAAPGQTVGALTQSLKIFSARLQSRASDAQKQADLLSPAILDLQGRLANAQMAEADLMRSRDLAEQQYVALEKKVGDAQIAAQDASSLVRIASAAASPVASTGIRGSIAVLAGALAAFVLGILAVLAWEWWHMSNTQPSRAISNDSGVKSAAV